MIRLTESIENNWNNVYTVWSCMSLNSDALRNLNAFIKKVSIILLLGAAYACLANYIGLSVPCPFRFFTGFLCPGCGITTLFLSLGHGDYNSAKQANVLLFYTLPLLVFGYCCTLLSPQGKISLLYKKYFMPFYLVVLLIFGFYRNM